MFRDRPHIKRHTNSLVIMTGKWYCTPVKLLIIRNLDNIRC